MGREEVRARGADGGRGVGGIERARSGGARGTVPARIVAGALAVLLSFGAMPAEDTFERALSLATEKRYAEAREVLDAVLEREPDHVEGRLLNGVLHARDGRLEEAIETFEALRREFPEMTEPYNNLAVLYALEDRLEEARETLLAVLERYPDPVAYANLGDVYTKLARRAYARAQELGAGDGRAGAGEMGATFAAPASTQRSSPTGVDGDAPETPAVEPGTVVASPAAADSAGPAESDKPAAAVRRREPAVAGRFAASESGEVVGAMASAFCTRAGGFEGRRAVAEAALWLQSQGAEVLEVRREERQVSGPWRVYLPPFASREEAQAKLREIRSRGVRDVAVIRDGEFANGISFGVYRDAANVRRRVTALDRLGYAAQSQATEVAPVGGYELKARTRGTAAAFEADWASRFPERPLRVVDCG